MLEGGMCAMKFFIFVMFFVFFVNGQKNLNYPFSEDPEILQNLTEIISSKGYSTEEYTVTTEDGYILGLQRIFPKKHNLTEPRRVAILQHGLLDSAHTWVVNFPNQSLGFILSDNGYDVWLSNSRGSTYSKKHIKYNTSDNKFWNFSWDEMARFDLTAIVKFVISKTNTKHIYYVGHSQGTMTAFAQLNKDAELRSHIKAMGALAPVAYIGHMEGFLTYLAYLVKVASPIIEWLGHGEFMPSDYIMRWLGYYMCRRHSLPIVCSNIIFLIIGYDTSNMNVTRLPVYIAHAPAGTSVKNMIHFAQGYFSDAFQMYDYGSEGNIQTYGQSTPPQYEFSPDNHVPLAVYYGGADWLSRPVDVYRAVQAMGSGLKRLRFVPAYNHLDFVWGENAATMVYEDLIDFFNKN